MAADPVLPAVIAGKKLYIGVGYLDGLGNPDAVSNDTLNFTVSDPLITVVQGQYPNDAGVLAGHFAWVVNIPAGYVTPVTITVTSVVLGTSDTLEFTPELPVGKPVFLIGSAWVE